MKPVRLAALLLALAVPLLIAQPVHADDIFAASERGDLAAVKTFLKADPGLIKITDDDGRTPLHKAASAGHAEVVDYLLSKGSDIQAQTKQDKYTPLHVADNEATAKVLLDNGADMQARDQSGLTPLHYALRSAGMGERTAVAKFLIARGAVVKTTPDSGPALLFYTNDPELVKLLVSKGADVNLRTKDGTTPLRLAVFYGNEKMIRVLLELGAKHDAFTAAATGDVPALKKLLAENPKLVLATDLNQLTPLHWAAKRGQKEAAELLIAKGAPLEASEHNDGTPLETAVACQKVEMVKLLLSRGADVGYRHKQEGFTPLHLAVYHFDEKMFEMLLEAGADVNAVDDQGRTPLHAAAEWDYPEPAKLLIENGADRTIKDNKGRTPLDVALAKRSTRVVNALEKAGPLQDLFMLSEKGDIKGVTKLLEEHPELAHGSNAMGRTPLHEAAPRGHKDVVAILLEKGADPSVKDREGRSPLCELLEGPQIYADDVDEIDNGEGFDEIPALLIDKGADIGFKDKDENTALHMAAANHLPKTAEFLVGKGANLKAVNAAGWTPLHTAARMNNLETARLLVAKGADVNKTDREGKTPIFRAVHTGNVELVGLLIANGAKLTTTDNSGRTPLHEVASRELYTIYDETDDTPGATGRVDIARLLIEKGADVNAKDKEGMTPMKLANENSRKKLVELLKEHGAK